jgi:redox-sensitive bicupin YhaK (pirin superfamily)
VNHPELDPFLMLDDFRSDIPAHYLKGFPWHPHRGIETITYVTKGDVEHGDSLGNTGVISSGDVQWMTAGSGIIHQEMPKGRCPRRHARLSVMGQSAGFTENDGASLPRHNIRPDPRRLNCKTA